MSTLELSVLQSDDVKEPVLSTDIQQASPDKDTSPHGILERNFSFLSCLGMAFAMLNSWTGA
jgi:hypothetical protein